MPIKFGTDSITPIYKGTTKIDKIFHGLNLVYQSGILPSGYTECEYIESTGKQWIDTGIKGGLDTLGVETKVYVKNTAQYYVLGNFNQTGQCGIMLRPADTTIVAFNCFVGNVSNTTNIGTINTDITFSNKNGDIIANGEVKGTIPSGTVKLKNSNLFIYGTSISNKFDASGRIYYLKVYSDLTQTTLIRNLIPCLDRTGTPCMYDLVSKQTFYNAGTGQFQFAIGGELPTGYKHVKWIQSSTTTQQSPSKPRIEIPFEYKDTMSLRWVESADAQSNNLAFYSGTTRMAFINAWTTGGKITARYGDTSIATGITPNAGQIYNMLLASDGFYVDGVKYGDSAPINYPSDTILVNCLYTSSYYVSTSKNYLIQIIDQNGELLLNAVPCLDNNNVPCLYDTVSKKVITKTPSNADNFLYEA